MTLHYHREIENTKKKILALSAMVEENFRAAVSSIGKRDTRAAKRVIESDDELDRLEVEVEEDCLKILALYQPVAIDLRYLVAMIKINNDLERIGDLAVNIAERSLYLSSRSSVDAPFDIPGICEKARAMLSSALDAMVNMDSSRAREVCAADVVVDEMHRTMYDQFTASVKRNPDEANYLLHLLSIARYVERVADHATNIAEDVIYLVDGEIVRHSDDRFMQDEDGRGG